MTVIEAEKFFGKQLPGAFIHVTVRKLAKDNGKNEAASQRQEFYKSNIAATIINADKNLIWLHDFRTGQPLRDDIQKVESYGLHYKDGQPQITGRKPHTFSHQKDGVYQIEGDASNLIFTRKNGEMIWYTATRLHTQQTFHETYVTSDKPLYKAGETVRIS